MNQVEEFIERNKDKIKNWDLSFIRELVEEFRKMHGVELAKLGVNGIAVLSKIIEGKTGEAEAQYLEAVRGKSVNDLLAEAKSDIHRERVDRENFVTFMRSVGTVVGVIFKAALRI